MPEGIEKIKRKFIGNLNDEFERLDYAYRVVDNKIVEVTSKQEIASIEDALNNSKDNIREHLEKALELYAKKPEPDLRNSIKESISAVESVCRELFSNKSRSILYADNMQCIYKLFKNEDSKLKGEIYG